MLIPLAVAIASPQIITDPPPLVAQFDNNCSTCGSNTIPDGRIDDVIDIQIDPDVVRPSPETPNILDPTLSPADNLTLPDYAASVPLSREGAIPGEILPQSPSLVDIAILGIVLPEPLLLLTAAGVTPPGLNVPELVLVNDDGDGETTTLFILQDPDAVDVSAPQEPDGVDIGPVTVANAAGVSALSNCQTAVQSLQNLPEQARTQSVYVELIGCYEEALEIAITAEDAPLQSASLANLATVHFVTGDYLTALDHYQQQRTIARTSNNSVQEGIALSGIGTVHAALGDYAKAIDTYEQSLPHLKAEVAPQWRSQTLRNLGNAYYAQQDYDQARSYQQQSLQLSHSTGDRYGLMQVLGNLGHLYAIAGDYSAALSAYQQSLELAETLDNALEAAQAELGIGTVYVYQQRYGEAHDAYQRGLTLTRTIGSRLGEGMALTNLGETLFRLNRLGAAAAALQDSISVWESLRAGLGTHDGFKVSLFETQLAAYRNLQEVMIQQNQVGPALVVAEQGRARAFVELVARGKPGATPKSAPTPTLAQLQQIARDRSITLVEYTIIRTQATEVPHGAAPQYPLSAPQLRDSALFIWVVQPSGDVRFQQVALDPSKTAAELVQTARRQIRARGDRFGGASQLQPGDTVQRIGDVPTLAPYTIVAINPTAGTATLSHPEITLPNPTVPLSQIRPATSAWTSRPAQLRQLHKLLIDPIEQWLPQDPTAPVVFIPQEQLFLAPFPALQSADGQYLVEQHTVAIAPAIQVLGLTRQSTPWQPQPLVVGNPSPMPATLSALPYAEQEAHAIAPILSTQPLLQTEATETTVKQQMTQASLIHLATHGFFNETQPLQGALALAPTAQQDGLLTAAEITELSLRAELVVLSACDTGRGRITGDGVIGLSRAFLGAGANSVVASLWQVSDESTATLMVAFYQQLAQGKTKAQALRQAMLTTRENYPSPHDWAAFTVIGTPE